MRRLNAIVAALCLAGVTMSTGAAHAGYDEGMAYYQKGDYFRALSELKPEAEKGNALAQVQVAGIYQYGLVGAANYGEALKWYRKAAAKGNPDAMLGLGLMYELGQGVPKDRVESVKWLTLASRGFPEGPDRSRILTALDTMRQQMSNEQLDMAQHLIDTWKPGEP